MKSFSIFLVSVLLALASFIYARQHYLEVNSATFVNPFKKSQSTTVTNPLVDHDIFGPWVKEEWVFALAVPAVLILGGLYLSTRRRS